MKAIRKSDGMVIDVDVYDEQVSWVSQVKTTYVDIDQTELYQESDLDFFPEKETEVIEEWISKMREKYNYMNKTKSQQAQEYDEKKIQETVPDEYRHDEQIYDADDIKYAYKQAYSDGYTACEQSKEDSEATLIQGWVAKLRELLERLVADGDIEPIHVSVDEIIHGLLVQ